MLTPIKAVKVMSDKCKKYIKVANDLYLTVVSVV